MYETDQLVKVALDGVEVSPDRHRLVDLTRYGLDILLWTDQIFLLGKAFDLEG